MDNCFTSVLFETDLSPKPVSLITDALGLLHASSKDPNHDLRLLHEAANVYGNAMRCLRQQLMSASRSKSPIQPRSHSILLSMMLLGLYGDPCRGSPHLSIEARSWTYHIEASAKFVNAVGPEGFTVSKPSDAAVVLSTVILTFKRCLSFRQTMPIDKEILHALCKKIARTMTIAEALFDWLRIFGPLPGLLAQADALMDSNSDTSMLRLAEVMQELVHMRPKMESYINIALESVITVEDPDSLDMTIEEHVVLMSNPLFPRQHRFPDLTVSVVCMLCWLAGLIADCTALRIIHKRLPNCTRTAKEIERGAFDTATQLCQCVRFFSERDSLTYVHAIKTMVALAGAFFAEAGYIEEAAWCRASEAASELRLRRLEVIRPRTLCRAFNVAPALVAAVRYRSTVSVQPKFLIV